MGERNTGQGAPDWLMTAGAGVSGCAASAWVVQAVGAVWGHWRIKG